jgi:hypothetical protein
VKYFNRDAAVMAKFDGEFAKGSDIYIGTARVSYLW